ncbi:inner membrane lipoprotein [Vibrio ichthyoenteri ATCC 700023]|uniref:Inner membrane lipoprotein n=1 Tax=Vibrio ichthyoenteri ATCC 700023 TaxID=870968 RepID=F9S4D4_9VIBR|nr:SslE/AcfD family lipoprotein zinc metalloprotease [Vibrio ichthyoenteri]EGU36844.1 inner membrane lipoprotein [Vibrio ichthyoenteri ATCC 700023]
MRNKLFLATMVSLALAGCNDEDIVFTKPDEGIEPPTDVTPPTEVEPPTLFISTLKASSKVITGDVDCNGSRIENGRFEVLEGTSFDCRFDGIILGEFTAPIPKTTRNIVANDKVEMSFDLVSLQDGGNATQVLQSINTCKSSNNICLNEIDAIDINEIYQNLDDQEAVDVFLKSKEEEATDEVGKAPSSHVDDKVIPAVDPEADSNLNADFVSADAESSYAYKPSSEGKVLTRSKLMDATGKVISGISFFSANATGMTDENGEFEYLWGDTLTFGIDTFEFGKITGNKIDYKLTDVSDNAVTKANIQALIERYADASTNSYVITSKIQDTFALYPNVINELINLSLPNGGKLEGSNFELPNEFEAQFNHGLTAVIDQTLHTPVTFRDRSAPPMLLSMDSGKYVTESLKKIFKNVEKFHVFNDNGSFYGATGYTRGMRALNISNQAFPIMMPRADKNREIPFNQPQAWNREGRPYIAEWPGIKMPAIPTVSEDNATFGFPFVTAGTIGTGKVVFMGNGMYPSILSCPENYWNNRSVTIDSQNLSCTSTQIENPVHDDNGSMQLFFSNLFNWFNDNKSTAGIRVATNIDKAYFAHHNSAMGMEYDFFISPSYSFGEVIELTKGSFDGISATDTPILILQAYLPKLIQDGMTNQFVADLDNSNLSQDDISALIKYLNAGGNILFMDAIQTANPEPIGRLADAAGVSIGGENVTPTNQAFCGSSYYCQTVRPNLHVRGSSEMVVLERFQDNQGEQPFTVKQDGSVEWIKDETKIKFEIPSYQVAKLDSAGKPVINSDGSAEMITKQARIFVNSAEERQAAIVELQAAFKGTPLCKNEYEWEFNCIETRTGHGKTVRGNYHRAFFDRYEVSPEVVGSMVKAANLGTNFTALYNHEIYYRSKGTQGTRLSTAELNQTYDNLSIWMWNDNPYRYTTDAQDELGFKQAVQFLNCYTNDQHQNDIDAAKCPADLKDSLISNSMIHGEGELHGQMNPSYPLNYMEKPLTRIMLGRSFWDQEITVDTTMYPGRTQGNGEARSATIQTTGKAVSYSAGNNQSTGLWAPQLQTVEVSGGVAATITVMFADDLTGKPNHEKSLKRPPRMQKSYIYDGISLTFKAPYGGLIYIQPKETDLETATFQLDGVEIAAWWKNGNWVEGHRPEDSSAPIAEVDTGSFIYTTPVNNIKSIDLVKFAAEMNRFADAASDFYGRDEVTEDGTHRRFTYTKLKEFRHRFVNDVQISIGSAHSGYPVMNSSFNADRTNVPTNAINDWLLWHEVGHNLASAPFSAEGSTEVTNNLLALYMQELEGRNDNPEMDRIKIDIQKAPVWLSSNDKHAWSNGDAGMRLVMFGQLKIWAKANFNIDDWNQRAEVAKSSIYGTDEGWNMFKLMHRLARNNQDAIGEKNYCSASETGLSGGDLMMVCSSYVAGQDLSDFFKAWNVGETSMTNPDGTKVYTGGISDAGLNKITELNLKKPLNNPLSVDSIYYSNH